MAIRPEPLRDEAPLFNPYKDRARRSPQSVRATPGAKIDFGPQLAGATTRGRPVSGSLAQPISLNISVEPQTQSVRNLAASADKSDHSRRRGMLSSFGNLIGRLTKNTPKSVERSQAPEDPRRSAEVVGQRPQSRIFGDPKPNADLGRPD
jgi:hypothetical protein